MLLPNKSYTAALSTQKPQLEEQGKGIEGLPLGSKGNEVQIKFSFFFKNFANEPDLDNLISSALDLMAVSGILANDKFVYSLDGSRKYPNSGLEATRIEISPYELGEPLEEEWERKEVEKWIRNWDQN